MRWLDLWEVVLLDLGEHWIPGRTGCLGESRCTAEEGGTVAGGEKFRFHQEK